MPTIEESGLGIEYDSTTTSVSELADLDPTQAAKKRRMRGQGTVFTKVPQSEGKHYHVQGKIAVPT